MSEATLFLGQQAMRVSIEPIDPAKARAWLDKEHPRNRRTPSVTARYVADMTEGAWLWSPQPFVFSVEDVLIDGGNRLRAIIDSGVTILGTVWRNVPIDVYGILDRGAGRSLYQADAMAGGDAPRILYQMGRLICQVDSRATVAPDVTIRRNAHALVPAWQACDSRITGMKIGGRTLRAGAALALCISWFSDPACAIEFADELRKASERTITPGFAVRNFLRWYENSTGGSGTFASRDTAWATAASLRQYVSRQDMAFVKPTYDAWAYWRKRPQVVSVLPI